MATDESYGEILDGLAISEGSALQRDVLATLSRHDEPALGVALNKNQMASKLWLADALLDAVGPNLGSVLVLGGWFGVLPSVLLHDPRFTIGNVVSLDIDPRCAAVALSLNATHVRQGRFAAQTGDMLDYDYRGMSAGTSGAPNVIINTCCEHLDDFGRWYDRIPAGQLLVAAVQRLLRVPRARQLRARTLRPSDRRPRCARCCLPASTSCGATSASC